MNDSSIIANAVLPRLSSSLSARSVFAAAKQLALVLERGQPIKISMLRDAMENAFGNSDADGAWDWKSAYDACEAAQVFFLRKFGRAILTKTGSSDAVVAMLLKIADLLPTHTHRSEESQTFQQFSTPIALGFVASAAAALTSADLVLEPSAGTGLLAIFAELAGSALALNEFSETRAGLLSELFSPIAITRFDAAQINDYLDANVSPSVVLMNPPFSTVAHVDRREADAVFRHVRSTLARLAEGGRLVAITSAGFAPDNPRWTEAFVGLQQRGRVVFSAALDGAIYAKHGTTTDTRLTVIDKIPAVDPSLFPVSAGLAPDIATLLKWVTIQIPPRPPIAKPGVALRVAYPIRSRRQPVNAIRRPSIQHNQVVPETIELAYELTDWAPAEKSKFVNVLYENYELQSIRIPGSQAHPTKLVQSAAMASVAPPKPAYRPHLSAAIVSNGFLSEAQLETVIYAGEAHSEYIDGSWSVDATYDVVSAAADGIENAVRFRRGFFLGDGTGAGKGRQAAGILLDNWLKGRCRALWISKSDKLIEDAQRDWSALGQEPLLVTPLSRFRQGTPIPLDEAILFTTYATIRSQEREGKASRVQQIVDWLGRDFDGVIIFDEAHAMANAAGGKGERGEQTASQQGKAGLRLQHALANARIVYVSATGATTVENLAYAQRLGLWGGADFPFANRAEFVQAIEAGGVAAMEVLARDLKALGLYAARSLSYEGVEYELLEHKLTPAQIRIYDAYAGAFQIIHNNLDAALEAANIKSSKGTLNGQALSAARSAFESSKQRFFSHLITAMKVPTLIEAIGHDLEHDHAAVIQIVSTGEALQERRLAEIPTGDWNDVQVDVTPREYICDYLLHSFPTQLHEPYTDSEGNLSSRPVFRNGQPVECREAVARRDRLIEHLAGLEPVASALDQIIQHFGTDKVAEVTGRSRRIVRKIGQGGLDRLSVESRAVSANLFEAQAFMDDEKQILVFSDAGGTGRSYHADLAAKNQRLRVHYLLEAGWRADTAIQGLGRSNRTNQAQPPLFRPIATDVKAEKRFLSTIARRLDTLGAITKGQRQTGGQGLFRADDNLESVYARAALRQFYGHLYNGKIEGCSLDAFQDATGLSLTDRDGTLKEDLPPITTFLNRLLALTIDLQNALFTAFEDILRGKIEAAIASGQYDAGVEMLVADSLQVVEHHTIHVHARSGAETRVFTIARKDRNQPMPLDEAFELARERQASLLVNAKSGRAAVQIAAPSLMLDDGEVERRVRLLRPMERHAIGLAALAETQWKKADPEAFAAAWTAELAEVPEFSTSTFHIVTGLLLPIWKRIPDESCKVYRLQTDAGERIIGRLVSPAALAALTRNLGLADRPELSPDDAWNAVLDGRSVLQLADGLQLRRVRVMNDARVELTGFGEGMRDRLRAMGLISEIISWKLRFFVPVGASGPQILARLLERHPLIGLEDRART